MQLPWKCLGEFSVDKNSGVSYASDVSCAEVDCKWQSSADFVFTEIRKSSEACTLRGQRKIYR